MATDRRLTLLTALLYVALAVLGTPLAWLLVAGAR